jgi:hypothetical protein
MPNLLSHIAVGFASRQTPTSHFGHFEGTESDLIKIVEAHLDRSVPVNKEGTILSVPVPPEGFWSSVRPLQPGDTLSTVFEARAPGEEPVIRTVCEGAKVPARTVAVILYHRDALGTDASTEAEWEVVSINPSPFEGPLPMDTTTMARSQQSRKGGTFQRVYTPEEWSLAAWFWATHANVQPR